MDTIAEKYGTYKGYDYLVRRIRGMHLCAYVRIPETHEFYGKHYDNIPIECHGGLTFSEFTDFAPLKKPVYDSTFIGSIWSGKWIEEKIPKGYWIGWDYAHAGDWMPLMQNENGKKWTPDEAVLEAKQVIEQLKLR